MIEQFVDFIMSPEVPVLGILFLTLLVNFSENVFPPIPGDTMLLVLGTLIGIGKVDFVTMLIASTAGSTLGFIFMFWLGKLFGNKVIETNRFKFLSEQTLRKPEDWFKKYGYWLIVANRFLSGTRAVISFFAGISHLRFGRTVLLSVVSSLVWNTLVLLLGVEFGQKWHLANEYISEYGRVILFVIIAIVAIWALYRLVVKFRNKTN